MSTLFLFAKYLNEEGCYCLQLSSDGTLAIPPAQRSFAKIKELQKDCSTWVVETSEQATLLELELPWLPERKARIAIPYALEDKLAQTVDELHFAFDKARYQNNHYLIAVLSKQRLRYIMQLFDEKNIQFKAITLDWFALESDELCVNEANLLVNTEHFKGVLSGELAQSYLQNNPLYQPLLFTDSQIMAESDLPKSEDNSYTWIARRILKGTFMNLCQGEMQHGNQPDWIKKSYQLAGILFVLWLISIIAVNAINLYIVNRHTATIDKEIAVIYHEFFPDAKQVISPKFRISQLLKNSNNEEQTRFWFLLNQFSKAMGKKQITLEQLRYQNKILSVTLASTDFAQLEQLENKLKKLQLHVKRTQASTHEQQIVATLELS